ncbi:MAG: hypothetical protein ISS78_09280 [Phycisphaerae bacterium]|nr:hypothetical protein [Phycisphaerae bacterium]
MTRDYNIPKTGARCLSCESHLGGGDKLVAALRQRDGEFIREDYCLACWDKQDRSEDAEVVGVWHTHVPRPDEKKKLLVDDEVLISFFRRLDDTEDPARINFRFVLALVLMRKKLLVYDRTDTDQAGTDVWTMHFRKSDEKHKVIDPKMDEERISEVSRSLSEIMEADV